MTSKKRYKDFESALERLEEITVLLESGKATLEESISLYTEGLEIAKFCDAKLSETEKQIRVIQERDGVAVEVDADGGEDAGADDEAEWRSGK